MHQRVEAFLVRGQWPERMAFDCTLVYGTAGGAAGELRSIANILWHSDTTVIYGNWIGPLMSALGGLSDVRFTPNSGHWNSTVKCLPCAKSRHMQCSKFDRSIPSSGVEESNRQSAGC